MRRLIGAAAFWLAVSAFGADKAAAPEKAPAQTDSTEASDTEAHVSELVDRIDQLEAELKRAVETQRAATPVRFTGYVDLGFFAPLGNGGAGTVQDFGNVAFPEYQGRFGWVFLGDLLAPVVNSRGEAADLGDLAGVERFDSVNSGGAPGFIANEVNLSVSAGLTEQLLLSTSLNFVPRTGSEFALGDFFDLDIAQVEWIPFANGKTSIFAGKMEPVIGIEYRDRKAVNRFGITPSLIARYTTGTQLGLKARTKLFPGDLLTVAVAVTNGSSVVEQFHFYNEVDTNAGKTLNGRLSLKLPLLGELELGASGEYGAQDRATDSAGTLWFVGADALYTSGNGVLQLKAQWLRGISDGRAVDRVYVLYLNNGGYLEADWRATPLLGLVGRGEWRDAYVSLTDERAYITKSWRATLGVRLTINSHVVAKAEYLLNREYGGVPNIANDVFTSSLILSY